MSNRKLEEKEIVHLSKQITELKELHQTLVAKEIEVNPYTMLLISDNLQKAIDNYKMDLYICKVTSTGVQKLNEI